MKYPHNNMITWNRLARELAQMLTTCTLYPSLLCDFTEPNVNADYRIILPKAKYIFAFVFVISMQIQFESWFIVYS